MRAVWCTILLVACGGGAESAVKPARPAAVVVRTQPVQPSERAPTATVTGTLVADHVVALKPETSAVVEAVRFSDGQWVRRGDVLLSLRDAEARAGLAEAEAALELALTELARTEALAADRHASAAAVDAARANVALARARRDGAAERLRRTVLRAPFDGLLGTRDVSPGDTVDPSRAVTTLVDLDPLRVEVEVPERLAGWLRTGLDAEVVVDSLPQQPVRAVVDFVDPVVAPASRTVRVRARLEDPPASLRPGMTATATLVLAPAEPVLRVPAEAVLTRADGAFVWVVVDGKASLRRVRTGERLSADVVVTEGLSAGDEVVVQGIARLREGVSVTVLGQEAAARVEAP